MANDEFETEEAPDIFLEQYEHQITDEPPDFERGRASAHRGAAYLQDNSYPPGGASAGQQGGIMRPEQRIEVFGEGNALDRHRMRRAARADDMLDEDSSDDLDILGVTQDALTELHHEAKAAVRKREMFPSEVGDIEVFGAGLYSRGLDALAGVAPMRHAVKPRAGFVKSASSHGVAMLRTAKVRPGDHRTSIANARDVGKRAVSIGNKLLSALKKIPKTRVHGAVVPKSPSVKRASSGKKATPALTVDQMKKIAANAVAAGKKLLTQADKQDKLVQAQAAKAKAAKAAVSKALSKAKIKMLSSLSKTSAAAKSGTATARASAAARPTSSAMRLTSATRPTSAQLRRATTMLGHDPAALHDYLGAYCDMLGEELPHPHYPGMLVNGQPDPNYAPDIEIFGLTGPLPDPYGDPYGNPSYGTDPYGNPVYPSDGSMSSGGFSADPSDPADPNHPGLLMSGKPDPAYGVGASVANDPAVQQIQAEIADMQPMPKSLNDAYGSQYAAQPGIDYATDPGPGGISYSASNRPLGAIDLDTVSSLLKGGNPTLGSLHAFDGSGGPGYKFSESRGWYYDMGAGKDEVPLTPDEAKDISAASMAKGYGPIIGRPDYADTKDLYFYQLSPSADINQSNGALGAFWYYDKAPDRVKAADNAARLQQAITDWSTDLTALRSQLAAAVYQAQVDAEQAIALQQQQALEDAAQQRAYEQEQADYQHQAELQAVVDQQAYEQEQQQTDIDATAQQRLQEIQDESAARQQQADDESLARLQQMEDERNQRMEDRELDLARQLDEAQAADAADAASSSGDEDAVPEQYMEDAAENEGGGSAFDTGNLDEYTDSDYVDEDLEMSPDEVMGAESDAEKRRKAVEAAKAILKKVLPKTSVRGSSISVYTVPKGPPPKKKESTITVARPDHQLHLPRGVLKTRHHENDIEVLGALTEAQKKRLKAYLAKILKPATGIHGDWQQGEGGEDAWEHGEGEGWAMDLDDGMAGDHPLHRVRGAERIRNRRNERR